MEEIFKCQQCGNNSLQMVQEIGTIHPVNMDEKGRPTIDFDAVPKEHYKQYYQCRICKEKLLDKKGKVISDHPGIKKWIKNQINNNI